MPRLTRYYGFNHGHFITTSTYRRVPVLDREPFRDLWVCALGKVRDALGFELFGYILMPEHFHFLFWSGPELDASGIVRSLKVRTGRGCSFRGKIGLSTTQPYSNLAAPFTASDATFSAYLRLYG